MNRKKILTGCVIPGLILLVWWGLTSFTALPRAILPSIPEVCRAFSDSMADGTLAGDLSVSLFRVLKGYALALVIGISLGSLMGTFPLVRDLVSPLLTAVRQVPVIAWIPLLILWCGIGEASKIAVITIAAFFPVTVNTFSGISSAPASFLEVARLYRLSAFETYRRIRLPWALPQILVGMKLGLGSAWMAVVAAELIASSSGIGYRLNYARGLMESDLVILCMIVIGCTGIVLDTVVSKVIGNLIRS